MLKIFFNKETKKMLYALNEVDALEGFVELKAGAVDAALEKHVPVVECKGNNVNVQVGSVEHPMLDVHYIVFVLLETNKGVQVRYLNPGEKPCTTFALTEGEKPLAVYEYCNLHGLWKKEL